MLKLTFADVHDLYRPLTTHKGVVRVVALSGGYTRDDACRRLTETHGMSDAEFNAVLAHSIGEIYQASTVKH